MIHPILFIPCWAVAPALVSSGSDLEAGGGLAGRLEWETEGGMESDGEEGAAQRAPGPLGFRQSPEPVLVEVSTEDGADVSSEP